MVDAETFFHAFIQAEHEALLSKYSDDDATFAAKAARVEAFFDPQSGAVAGGIRRGPMTAEDFVRFAPNRARLAPRVLFKVRAWRDAKLGETYGAYVGSTAGAPTYFSLFLARTVGPGLRIVAELLTCSDCRMDNLGCSSCGGVGWQRASGLRVDLRGLGTVVSSSKLTPPAGPERADYDLD